MAELMRRDFDVYLTLVDDQQIDCILRIDGTPPRYLDIQIKARSKHAKNPGTFAALDIRNPRPDFIFIFYSEAAGLDGNGCYWVMPSLDVVRHANVGKSGGAAGKYRLVFTNTLKDGEVRPRPKWDDYKNAFHLLKPHRD